MVIPRPPVADQNRDQNQVLIPCVRAERPDICETNASYQNWRTKKMRHEIMNIRKNVQTKIIPDEKMLDEKN